MKKCLLSIFFLYSYNLMGDYMNFKIGDYVTIKTYDNDLVFKIRDIDKDIAYLVGINIRLCADSKVEDLNILNGELERDEDFVEINMRNIMLY